MRLLIPTIGLVVFGACAEPDPNYGPPGGIIQQKLPNATGGGGAASGTSGAAAADPFGGPYDANANKPTTTLRAAHAAATPPGPTPDTKPFPDCLTCHTATGVAKDKPWGFGGQVANNLAGVDVVVTDGTSKLGPVKSDDDGFFWAPGALGKGNVTVRKGDAKSSMIAALLPPADGGCLQTGTCHGGTKGPLGASLH